MKNWNQKLKGTNRCFSDLIILLYLHHQIPRRHIFQIVTKEDLDVQLEGISSLLGDSEPIDSINQDVMMQKDKLVPSYSVPFINVLLPSPAVEVEAEAEKMSGNLISDVRSRKEKKTLADNTLEWKDV